MKIKPCPICGAIPKAESIYMVDDWYWKLSCSGTESPVHSVAAYSDWGGSCADAVMVWNGEYSKETANGD